MLPRLNVHRHLAARASASERQTWPCHRLSACHPFSAPQANGAAQSRLSRPALPSPRLRPGVRRLARWTWREASLPRLGLPVVVVTLPPLAIYDEIAATMGEAA